MPASLRCDAIVVGAGPAGVAAAITMAKGGLEVCLIERGRSPGAKNLFGGVLYTHALAEVLPDYAERAPPFERPVTEQGYWLLSPDSAVRIMHRSERYKTEPAGGYTVLRARFDAWFAEQAVQAGVLLIAKTTVTRVLRDDAGRAVGVATDRPEGEVQAPILVIAEGVNNLLTQSVGLAKGDLPPRFVALSVKEVPALPAAEIEARFGLAGAHEGVAIDIFGDATLGLPGTAFIYTDAKAISIGVGLLLEELVDHNLRPNEILARFKAHPVVRPYLAGATVLVAGDAAAMVDALHREGSNLAMTAGRMAGETALEAHRRQDFSAAFLRAFRTKLEESFVLKDLKQYRRMTDFLDSTPYFIGTYVDFMNEAALRYFTAQGMPKRQMEGEILGLFRGRRSFFGIAHDMMKLLRGMRG